MNVRRLGVVGLILLGTAAAGLSGAAMVQYRGTAAPVDPPAASPSGSPGVAPSAPMSPAASPSASPSSRVEQPSVVVIGDSHSVGEPDANWIGKAAKALGWGEVTNLSSPGRGYVQKPRSCELDVCANLEGSVALIAALKPDVVVTFGGAADGDTNVDKAVQSYFGALRESLPEAKLIAITPVTGDAEVPAWMKQHQAAIVAAVESVGGRVVDVGQPGLGDGRTLSAQAQRSIAESVVSELSGS